MQSATESSVPSPPSTTSRSTPPTSAGLSATLAPGAGGISAAVAVSNTASMAARGQPRFDVDQMRRRLAQVRLGDDADACHDAIVQRSIALMMAVSAAFTGQSMPARRPSAATAPFM